MPTWRADSSQAKEEVNVISEQDQHTLRGLFEGLQSDLALSETRFIQQVLRAVEQDSKESNRSDNYVRIPGSL